MSFATQLPAPRDADWKRVFDHTDRLGESPYWDSAAQVLVWVDIGSEQVLRGDPRTGQIQRWNMDLTPGCIAPANEGGYVLGLREGVFITPEWGGDLRRAFPYRPAAPGLRLNDGRADPFGNFWVGSYSELREPTATLMCVRPDRQKHQLGQMTQYWHLERTFGGFASSNGLAFSNDRMSWSDTSAHVFALKSYSPNTGRCGEVKSSLRFAPKPKGWVFSDDSEAVYYTGRPDGACVDAEGCFWVAMYEGGSLLRVDGDGFVRDRVRTPTLRPTMPCLGGPDFKTLYLTSAQAPEDSTERIEQPLGGSVWRMRVEVPGLPVDAVRFGSRNPDHPPKPKIRTE